MLAQTKRWWKCLYAGGSKGILAGLAAHSGQISVGMSQGYSAILTPIIIESGFATVSQASWAASLGVVSNPIGALIAGVVAEFFGRRAGVALAILPHVTGWIIIALANNIPLLYAGRFISGLGTGMANGLYLYVSEVAAPEQRGWLASLGPALVSLGVLMVYSFGAITTWQKTAAISIAPAILSLALARFLPETPSWLVTQNRTEDAKKVLVWLRGPGIKTEIEHKELCARSSRQDSKRSDVLHALQKSNVWKPFVILFFFFLIQQLSGIYIILFYAVSVLQAIGLNVDEYSATVAIGGVRLFASILGAGLARIIGRKTLGCISGLGMALSAGGVALSIRLSLSSWIPLLCIATHVSFSMIGYLTLPWVMTSELYPLRFRGSLSGVTTGLAQLLTFAAIKTYPELSDTFGTEFIMWVFGGAGLTGAIFALTVLPETRGRSLDQIESKFSSKRKIFDGENPPAEETVQVKHEDLQKISTSNVGSEPVDKNNGFVYDNVGLDMAFDDSTKPSCDTDSDAKGDDDKNSMSIEHMYL